MPSHGACWAPARRRPGADPMRAHVPRNGDFFFNPPETRGPVPQWLSFLRGDRIAGIKDLLGQADWIKWLQALEEVRRVIASVSPILGTRSLSKQAPAGDAVTPSWPKSAARAMCPAPLSKEAAQATGKLWGSGGAGTAPAAAILQVWLVTCPRQAGGKGWTGQAWRRQWGVMKQGQMGCRVQGRPQISCESMVLGRFLALGGWGRNPGLLRQRAAGVSESSGW